MKTVLILSSWSSGSTAMAGFLDQCGAYSCPPHVMTKDGRTPNAYEPLAYMQELAKLFDLKTLNKKGSMESFAAFFEPWWNEQLDKARAVGKEHIVLKHPLQSFILPYLDEKLDPTYVLVTRPFEDIESTRVRRKWTASFGAEGAKLIYVTSYNFLTARSRPYLAVPFNAFRTEAGLRQKMLNYVDLTPSVSDLAEAEAFLRP